MLNTQTEGLSRYDNKEILLIGCGIVVLISVILVGLFLGWIVYVSQDVKGVSISINVPLEVIVGNTFEMVVNVKNERGKKALALSDIDLGEEYLAGFVVVSTEPPATSSMRIPFVGGMSYTFDVSIPAGEVRSFAFTLRAEQTGIYRGDVDICEGSRFATSTAQTVVKDE
jgi:hypothetical protein